MSHQLKPIYEFGPYRLDAAERLLSRDGEVVPLQPKVFDLLLVMVECHGRLLEKDELMKAIWPDTVVEEVNLANNISILRKTISENGQQFIETVPKRGYRFVAEVREVGSDGLDPMAHSPVALEEKRENVGAVGERQKWATWRKAAIVAGAAALCVAAWVYFGLGKKAEKAAPDSIRSIAVLPFKPLNRSQDDEFLGIGLADAVITRLSGPGKIIVRPTSAVRKYATQEVEAMEAARQLQVDAVIDGTYQSFGDRLRVSVNLLRAADQTSLWTHRFDLRSTDIFAMQDEVSQQVAAQLRIKLSPAEQARLANRPISNLEAYNYYTRAMYHFGDRGLEAERREESDKAIELFKKAIDMDPAYAQAHAQLGYAYAWTAVFIEDNPALIARAKEELKVAERLDPQLAEIHVARYIILWSQYEGFQSEAAMRELRLAQQIDPYIANTERSTLYWHMGLEEQADKEIKLALERDPTNEYTKRVHVNSYFLLARPEEGLAAGKRFFDQGPDAGYFLEKRMLKEAAPLVQYEYEKNTDSREARKNRALWLALQGKHTEAEAEVPAILAKIRRHPFTHHIYFDIARVYSLGGKSEKAVEWLRMTVKEGFPCYPLFARDSFLDRIRKSTEFIRFMIEMKERWEVSRREFG